MWQEGQGEVDPGSLVGVDPGSLVCGISELGRDLRYAVAESRSLCSVLMNMVRAE